MNKTKIIIIDSDELCIKHIIDKLNNNYIIIPINNLDAFDIGEHIGNESLFIIDPNSFPGRGIKVYHELIMRCQNVIVTVYPYDNSLCERDALDSGVLEFLKKPLSPSLLATYITKRLGFIERMKENGHSAQQYISFRQSLREQHSKEFVIELVEDSNDDAMKLFELLQPECDIRWYKSADAFKSREPDVVPDIIILDIIINGHNSGYDIYRSIQADLRLSNIPVLFLTSSWQIKKIEYGLKLGATDYILKAVKDEASIKSRIISNIAVSQLINTEKNCYA